MADAIFPEIQFIDSDTSKVEAEIISAYESISGKKLYPGDPVRIFLSSLAYIISILKFNINYTGLMNLLAFAKGEYLDAIGELYGVSRLEPTKAVVTMRFYIDEPLEFDVVIPKGTAITPDKKIFFKTVEEIKITSSNIYADVMAECEIAGDVGNGFLPGQINQLASSVPYISKVENITTSMGGADTEDDERYRDRIRISIERFSVAGPRLAYEYWAKTAHKDIIDIGVWSPEPGKVNIVALMKDGELPTDEINELIYNTCSDDTRRPLTDFVSVIKPEIINYNIELEYYILKGFEVLQANIDEQVKNSVAEYIYWQKTKLGRDIRPTVLIDKIQSIKGIQRVNLIEPEYKKLEIWQVAYCDNSIVRYAGAVDE